LTNLRVSFYFSGDCFQNALQHTALALARPQLPLLYQDGEAQDGFYPHLYFVTLEVDQQRSRKFASTALMSDLQESPQGSALAANRPISFRRIYSL
jgi:hypothetical protein